jgi:hypothetical protein
MADLEVAIIGCLQQLFGISDLVLQISPSHYLFGIPLILHLRCFIDTLFFHGRCNSVITSVYYYANQFEALPIYWVSLLDWVGPGFSFCYANNDWAINEIT